MTHIKLGPDGCVNVTVAIRCKDPLETSKRIVAAGLSVINRSIVIRMATADRITQSMLDGY